MYTINTKTCVHNELNFLNIPYQGTGKAKRNNNYFRTFFIWKTVYNYFCESFRIYMLTRTVSLIL